MTRVLPSIRRLGQVTDTKFGTNVSNKTLLKAGKYQGYSFLPFLSYYRENQQVGLKFLSPAQISINQTFSQMLREPLRKGKITIKNSMR